MKFKEFWISDESSVCPECGSQSVNDAYNPYNGMEKDNKYHVIEKTAYDQLLEVAKDLAESLEVYHDVERAYFSTESLRKWKEFQNK